MRIPLAAVLVLVGCGGGDSGTPDAPADTSIDAPLPAFGTRMPQAVAGDPTDIMAAPKGMAITWDNDPLRADEEKFFGEYGASTAWTDQTGEYGVGPLTAATPGHITGNAPATVMESTLLALLTTNTTGATPTWGSADESTIYMFFLPVGTVLDDGTGSMSCRDYDGYHFDMMIGSADVAYGFSAACDDEAKGLGITDLQDVMITAGHETVEAATDPRVAFANNTGWSDVDDAHSAFAYETSGELGDLCEYAATQDWVSPPGMDYSIQRTWSNKAAAAGHDPCVGDGTTPYYQTIPDDADTGTVNYQGVPRHTAGTKVAVSATGTIHLRVYSDTPGAGPFTVKLYDLDGGFDAQGNDTSPVLTFVQPTGTYMPGDAIDVPVTVKAADQYVTGGAVYEVDTTPVSGGGPTTEWWAWVLQ